MWDERYSGSGYLFGTEPAAGLRAHAHRLEPGSHCLCIADGEGRNSVWLAGEGHAVTAWDGSSIAIEKARKLAADRRVSVDFSVQTAENFDWSARQYDAVIAIFIQFADPALRHKIFQGMKDATRPGGMILLHGYTPKQLEFKTGGPPFAENLYTEDLLKESFEDFDIELLKSYEQTLEEGSGHSGRSALIDLVARKTHG